MQTSDNVNYFVNAKYGIIAGRQLTASFPEIRTHNFFDLVVRAVF